MIVEQLRKQLGIESGIPIEEYSLAVGIREISSSKIDAVEVFHLKRAFIEVVKFDGKLIFFPTRVSFTGKTSGKTAVLLSKFLRGEYIPFKNFKKFPGKEEDQKFNFLEDLLRTIIDRSAEYPINVITIPYKDGRFLADDYPITFGDRSPFLFRGRSFSLKESRSLLFDKAKPVEILLYRRLESGKGNSSRSQFTKTVPWEEFKKRVGDGEIQIVKLGVGSPKKIDFSEFENIIRKWEKESLEDRSYELRNYESFRSLITKFL